MVRVELTENGFPEPFPIVVTVKKGTTVLEAFEVMEKIYSPDDPMNKEELLTKFDKNNIVITLDDVEVEYNYKITDDLVFMTAKSKDEKEEKEKVEVELIVDKFEELGELLKRMVDER